MDKNLLIFSEPVIFAVFVENFLEFKAVEKRIGFLVRNAKSTCHFVNFGFRKDSIVEKTGLKYKKLRTNLSDIAIFLTFNKM